MPPQPPMITSTGAGSAALPPPVPLLPPPSLSPPAPERTLAARTARSLTGTPPWYRPALVTLAAATAVTYLWGLGASGWANSYYSAAVQAGASSWKAFFFGSFDAANSITVDKPPAALWLMSLSARLFGVNSWSILVPEALCGVATVVLLVVCVKRWFGPVAGLLAGAVLATTPVAALMFRFNNPDALLVLLLTGAAYATTLAIERGSTRWLVLAGTLVGFGFLTKMLQAFIVLPAFALAYLIAAPPPWWKRLVQLAAMGAAVIVSAGWWVAIVELWPASSRPYIGGSQDNSVLELVFGYNGLGRLTGNETGSVGGGGGTTGRWGETGLLRMFNRSFGGQISWLLPAALLLLAAGLALTLRRARTDRTRAALIVWGGWLLLTAVVFSLGQGIIHEYYTVALGPAIGAVIGIGAVHLWQRRASWWARAALAAALVVTGWWATRLLGRAEGWNPWLTPVVIVLTVAGAATLLVPPAAWRHLGRVAAASGIAAALIAPAAASVATAATPHSGAIPLASPTATAGRGGLALPGVGPGMINPPRQATGRLPGAATRPSTGRQTGGPPANAGGGLLNATNPSAEVVAALEADASSYTWVLATIGANNASGYQLATDLPVMAIGGFNGTDPSPTLAEFQALVAKGAIHYFAAGRGVGGSSASSSITSWVTANFPTVEVGGTTFYDLTAQTS